MNWNGKCKAVTFSYDDGVESDRRLAELFRQYGLKCTFNLNSGALDDPFSWRYEDRFDVYRLRTEGIAEVYAGHEIAVHGVKHLPPTELETMEQFDAEFVEDRKMLTKLFGVEPIGMAYAYGVFDDRTVERLRAAGFRYGRTVWDADNFDLQEDLLRFRPTCHHKNERVFELIDQFLAQPANPQKPQLFYLWGHAYELDGDRDWDRMEEICKRLSGHEDIFYGTNREVLL